MESKQDYVNRIYNEARVLGLCKRQKDFAQLLGMNQSTLSSALQGNGDYLTDSIIRRFKAWEKQVLEPKRGPRPEEKPAQPDILIPAATAALYNNMSETIRIQAEIIARLQGGAARFPVDGYAPKNTRTDLTER